MNESMQRRTVMLLAVAASMSIALAGCAAEEVDPLAVTNSATITDITDNTATGYYTVDTARLTTTAVGTELTLDFTISNANSIKFSPVSTITFTDGTVLVCEADGPREVPSLVASTDSWDFACDADDFPADSAEAALVVIDAYN
ncbi:MULTISPECIES: hypothetical protein [unclassified Plantibacter]|uniref:hypothetical protein n=1 Tax=unclassified Plantibacter TaxID=2624265 RepID=UPI000A8D14D6|nr:MULTISPECIES: hypothetical protein [unclassified Plantibacter]